VSYARPLLDALLDNLGDLTPLERYTLVDDAWASVLAGTTAAAAFVATAERFGEERDLSVWERITGSLTEIDRLVDSDAAVALHTRVAALVGPVRVALGAESGPGDDDRTRTLRGVLLQAAALLGDDAAAQERAAELLDRFLAHPPSVDPGLAAPALAVSATLGDVALHERLVGHYRDAGNPQDRQRLLFSLTRFRDAKAFDRTLALSLSDDVRTQDAPYVLAQAIANRDNGPAAWRFVASHWAEIEQRFPANSLSRLVGGVRSLRDRAQAQQVAEFLAEHPIPQGDKQVLQHLERMWVTVALAEREAGRLPGALTG
jgi:puromycin-sensitive aminopeptidase